MCLNWERCFLYSGPFVRSGNVVMDYSAHGTLYIDEGEELWLSVQFGM